MPTMKVYSRKKKLFIIPQVPNFDLISSNENVNHDVYVNNDLDLLITLRKETRSCTQHPISHFVSFERLFPQDRAFTSKISFHEISTIVYETLNMKRWKEAMNKEMRAF